MNCKIHPILYHWYLILREQLGATIVHRRKRGSETCIEVVFYNDMLPVITGRLNTLKDAEECGYWVMCRLQTTPKHMVYKGHRVYQLFLTPVHPKKWRKHMPIFLPAILTARVSKAAASG